MGFTARPKVSRSAVAAGAREGFRVDKSSESAMLKQFSPDDGPQRAIVNHGWRVTLGGTGINFGLGIVYSWSVIRKAIYE